MVPLTVIGLDETRPSGLPYLEQELRALVHFVCKHILMTPLGN
jgi:hypothetical protein